MILKQFKYLFLLLLTFLLNRNVSATEIVVVENQNTFLEVIHNQTISKENTWLGLLYLKEKGKLVAYNDKTGRLSCNQNFSRVNLSLIDAWEMLLRNGRTGLKTDIDALTSLNTLLSNSKLTSKLSGKTTIEIENLLANMKGWSGASYKQVCDKVNLLVDELPTNVTGLDKYLGSAGFGNGNVYTNRHSWVQLERLLVNKNKLKIADEIIFENPISFNGFNSVTDVYLRIGSDIFEIETKAGIKFFENITSNSSNFSRQSFNSLNNVNKLENYKVFLNPTVKDALGNTDKLNVINAWKNWEGGILLNNPNTLNLFTDFAKRTSGNNTLPMFTSQTLENYLTNTDSWFDMIFKTDLIP